MSTKKALALYARKSIGRASTARLSSSVSARPSKTLPRRPRFPRPPMGALNHTAGVPTMQTYAVEIRHPYLPRFAIEVRAASHADAARIAAEQHVALFGVAPAILSTTPKK